MHKQDFSKRASFQCTNKSAFFESLLTAKRKIIIKFYIRGKEMSKPFLYFYIDEFFFNDPIGALNHGCPRQDIRPNFFFEGKDKG